MTTTLTKETDMPETTATDRYVNGNGQTYFVHSHVREILDGPRTYYYLSQTLDEAHAASLPDHLEITETADGFVNILRRRQTL